MRYATQHPFMSRRPWYARLAAEAQRLAAAGSVSGYLELRAAERTAWLGWVTMGGFGAALIGQTIAGQLPHPLLAAGFLVGLLFAARKSRWFGMSRSTRQLEHAARQERFLGASLLHVIAGAVAPAHVARWRRRRLLVGGLAALAIFAAAFAYGLGATLFAPTPGWQVLLLIAPFLTAAALLPELLGSDLVRLLFLALFGLLIAATDLPVSLFLLMLVALAGGGRAIARSDWKLGLIAILGTYSVLLVKASQLRVSELAFLPVIAELAIVAWLGFALPFTQIARQAADRAWVRWIISANTFAFTTAMLWLVDRMVPGMRSLLFLSVLLTGSACAMLAWAAYRRYSYAKYFLFASLGSVLVLLTPLLPSGTFQFLVWFVAAVYLCTVGIVIDSYATRLAGLGTLIASCAVYLLRIVPFTNALILGQNVLLQDAVWSGLLLSGFTALVAVWFADGHYLPPKRQRESYAVSGILFSLSLIVLLAAILNQLILFVL